MGGDPQLNPSLAVGVADESTAPRGTPPVRPDHRPPGVTPASRAGIRALLSFAARGSAAGAGTAALIVLLRWTGLLDGIAALVVAAVVALAFPTSRLLTRRVLIAGALAFGAAPLLWLARLPVGPWGRMTWSLALAAGGLAAWLAWPDRAGRAARARRVLVRLRPVDAVLAASFACSVAVTAPRWRVADPARALAMLAPGWDNSAHTNMALMIRRYGSTLAGIADPAGDQWTYRQYPQGFHTAAVAVMELLAGPRVGTVRAELVTYVHASAWLLVAVTTMLVAGLAALPWARRGPWLLAPAAFGVVVAMTLVQGGQAFVGGFPNFTIAVGLTACVVLLAATMPRLAMPLHVAALAALVVAVAQGWLLLLVLAGPATLVVARRHTWRAPRAARHWTLALLVLAVTGLAFVAATLGPQDPRQVLVIPGGMVAHDPRVMAAVALLTPCAVLALAPRFSGLLRLAPAPIMGLLAAGALGAYQKLSAGALSYYFWKLLLGVEIVDLLVVAIVWVRVTATWRPRSRAMPPAVAGLGIAALVLTVARLGVLPGNAGIYGADRAWTASAQTVLRAADEVSTEGRGDRSDHWTLLTESTSTFHPMSAQQWLLALTGRWTVQADAGMKGLLTLGADKDVAAAARDALGHGPDSFVVAPPGQAGALRAALGSDAGRVLTWTDPAQGAPSGS